MKHKTPRLLVSVLVIMLAGACTQEDGGGDPTTSAALMTTSTAAAVGTTIEAGLPRADFAWDFNGDGSASAGGIDLEFAGGVAQSEDAVAFDGYTGYAVAPGPVPFDTAESFTVSAWVSYAEERPDCCAVIVMNGVESYALAISVDFGSWALAMHEIDKGLPEDPGVAIDGGPATTDPSRWTYVAGVYDQDAGVFTFYLDGQPVGEAELPTSFTASGPLTIGGSLFEGPNHFWPGSIAGVAIYLSALTPEEIAGLYESMQPVNAPPPMAEPDPSAEALANQDPCPNSHGGACRGWVDAGTYATRSFSPAITYTLPDGWGNLEDLPGNFLLQQADDPRYLGIYQNVRIPKGCAEAQDPDVGGTVDDIVGWYRDHPGLVTSGPESVTVGGLSGVYLDISLDPSWATTCIYSGGEPIVPFMIGSGVSEVHHVILPGFEERLYLLEWEGGNVAIEVGTEGMSLDDYLEDVLPVIETLSFSR